MRTNCPSLPVIPIFFKTIDLLILFKFVLSFLIEAFIKNISSIYLNVTPGLIFDF